MPFSGSAALSEFFHRLAHRRYLAVCGRGGFVRCPHLGFRAGRRRLPCQVALPRSPRPLSFTSAPLRRGMLTPEKRRRKWFPSSKAWAYPMLNPGKPAARSAFPASRAASTDMSAARTAAEPRAAAIHTSRGAGASRRMSALSNRASTCEMSRPAGYGLERTPGLQKAVGPVGYPRPDALALYAQLVQVETSGIASGRETPGEPQQRVVVMCYGLEYVQVGTCVTIVGKSRKCLRSQRTPQNLRSSLGGSTRRTVGPSPRSVDTGPFENLRHPRRSSASRHRAPETVGSPSISGSGRLFDTSSVRPSAYTVAPRRTDFRIRRDYGIGRFLITCGRNCLQRSVQWRRQNRILRVGFFILNLIFQVILISPDFSVRL